MIKRENDTFFIQSDSNSQIFTNYLLIIKENIIPILIIFLLSVIITIIYLISSTSIFSATTLIKIDDNSSTNLNMTGTQPNFYNPFFMDNQLQMIKGFDVRDRVAEALEDTISKDFSLQKYYLLVKDRDTDNYRPLNRKELRIRLRSFLKISQEENLNVISLSVEGPYFDECVLITTVYAEKYMEYLNELKSRDLSSLKSFLAVGKQKKLEELKEIEMEIEEYKTRYGISSIEDYSKEFANRFESVEQQIIEVKMKLVTNEIILKGLIEEKQKIDSLNSVIFENELSKQELFELSKKINELKLKKNIELSKTFDIERKKRIEEEYLKEFNVLDQLKKEELNDIISIDDIEYQYQYISQSISETETENIYLIKQLEYLENEFQSLLLKLKSIPIKNIELLKLQRNKATNENLYLLLEQRYQETEILENRRVSDANILDPGSDVPKLVKPKKTMVIIFGSLLGISIGLLFAFFRNSLDKTIKTPEQLEKAGVTLISWIPLISNGDKNDKSYNNIFINNYSQIGKEAFKSLRSRIQFTKPDLTLKKIMITSSLPSEGKTFIAVNLATSFALLKKKVLLIDCDLRKSKLHKYFNVAKEPGVTDYIFEKAELNSIIKTVNFNNSTISFITSGTLPPNPVEIIDSEHFNNLIFELEKNFDLIIFDSPPVLSVIDSEILYRKTDATILIGRAEQTELDIYLKTYNTLFKLNENKLLGGVLNNFNINSVYGKYYQYYNYYNYKAMDLE